MQALWRLTNIVILIREGIFNVHDLVIGLAPYQPNMIHIIHGGCAEYLVQPEIYD